MIHFPTEVAGRVVGETRVSAIRFPSRAYSKGRAGRSPDALPVDHVDVVLRLSAAQRG